MEKRAQADELQQSVLALVDSSVSYGLSLATAIGILIAGYIISKWASRAIRRRLEAVDQFDRTLIPIVAQIARYAILIFTGILVLAEFGIQTTSIIAVLGAAGLAIGLALQGTLQNVAAGLMLLMIRPFRVGDYVDVADSSGTVDEIGLFMTRLHTPQSIFIAIPNSKIWSNTITNYSMRPNRRLDLTIGISYDDDIDTAVA
ncbi:MAG: mechanosensitive ion channel, partial [Hyphomicrobiales bacterium]|nr:mechanosensitive ion channel [Hyphomicrobiales bacterium]